MSLELNLYVRQISDADLGVVKSRLNDFEMTCETHPETSLINHSGFLPFKFKLINPPFEVLRDKELTSGFELDVDDFDLEIERLNNAPRLNFFQRLLSKKVVNEPLYSPEIDAQLASCTKRLTFTWHASDSFEFRFVKLTSAKLAELKEGLLFSPEEDIWYNNRLVLREAWEEVKEYESSLTDKTLRYLSFTDWL